MQGEWDDVLCACIQDAICFQKKSHSCICLYKCNKTKDSLKIRGMQDYSIGTRD